MAEVTVAGDGVSAPVTVDTNAHTDEVEIDTEWLKSSFATVQTELSMIAQTLTELTRAQTALMEAQQATDAKIPNNLTMLLSDQQTTITQLVRESQETTRQLITSLTPTITSTLIPSVQPVEHRTEPEHVAVAEATPVPVAEHVSETTPKRRRI